MQKIDFSKGPVWKCIIAQAVPLTIAQLIQLLYNVVDRIYNAKTYKIVYVDCQMPTGAPTLHTYGASTPLASHPSKEGWIFVGWEIVNYDPT